MSGIKLGDLTLFTVEELAELLEVQERTIRSYLNTGKLKGRKLAGRWYVTEDSLKEYFGQTEREAEEPEAQE